MNDLRLLPPPDPDRDFTRELDRMRTPHANEPQHITARRRALADAIERAHASWSRKGQR